LKTMIVRYVVIPKYNSVVVFTKFNSDYWVKYLSEI